MRFFACASLLILLILSFPLRADEGFCGVRNGAFQAGETITFKILYSVAGLNLVTAGEAVFRCNLEQLNGKGVYHITGEGKSNNFIDNFFKVRDKYESFIDTGTLQPAKFIRNIQEGEFKKYENVTFNKVTNTAITTEGLFKVPACVQDVLSSIYYARNINFSSLKQNDTIPFNMFLDNQVYSLYIRYLGKETIKTRYGKFRTIKFKPLLIKGTIFEGGEKMTVWVSDDRNHIPVRVESPISVGSIKAEMINYSNRRNPLSSLIGF
jgi:hypothetical protein